MQVVFDQEIALTASDTHLVADAAAILTCSIDVKINANAFLTVNTFTFLDITELLNDPAVAQPLNFTPDQVTLLVNIALKENLGGALVAEMRLQSYNTSNTDFINIAIYIGTITVVIVFLDHCIAWYIDL